MWVVYQLAERGVYVYRVYATGPLPEPGEPLDEDASIPFREQLKVDYYMGINHRPTPGNILQGEDIVTNLPQLPEPRP